MAGRLEVSPAQAKQVLDFRVAFLAGQLTGLGDGPGLRRAREALEFCQFLRAEMPDLLDRWREQRRGYGQAYAHQL